MTSVSCIIPARIGSTRLPEKPLQIINGIPLIVWVYRNAEQSHVFDDVIVATDDKRIADAVSASGGKVALTSADHASGTDRVHEAVQQCQSSHIVNIQGDEPRIPHDLLRLFTQKVQHIDDNSLLTLVSHATIIEKNNPNVVKAVLDRTDNALYFSRSPVPFERSTGAGAPAYKHIGMYGFSRKSLERFCSFPPGALEQTERLEQLRALENGMTISCMIHDFESIGIDTPEDLEQFRLMMTGKHYEHR